MQNFITFNALGIFSLVILVVVYFQANNYLENNNTKLKKIWLSSIALVFIVQLLDIISLSMVGFPGNTIRVLSYISNFLLFSFMTAMSSRLALFIEYSIEFSDKAYKTFRKIFSFFVIINSILALLNIPFGLYFRFDEYNNFVRGSLYFVPIVLTYLPLFIVLFGVVLKCKNKSFKTLVLTGIIFPSIFVILQFLNISPIPIILPSITTFILIMNSLLTINAMYIEYLTGLKNMRGVDKYFFNLPATLDNYLVVLYIDFNQFKRINDLYGHKEGDNALCAFSKILTKILKSDDLIARIGGDEFIIATRLNKPGNVKLIINKIKNEVEKYNAKSPKPYKLSISYGYSIQSPGTVIDKDKLIEQADKKMYEHKSNEFKKTLNREAL